MLDRTVAERLLGAVEAERVANSHYERLQEVVFHLGDRALDTQVGGGSADGSPDFRWLRPVAS